MKVLLLLLCVCAIHVLEQKEIQQHLITCLQLHPINTTQQEAEERAAVQSLQQTQHHLTQGQGIVATEAQASLACSQALSQLAKNLQPSG